MPHKYSSVINNLPDDPLDRVPPALKTKIENNSQFLYDVHCHFFTFYSVPNGFLKMRLPFRKRVFTFFELLLHGIIGHTDQDILSSAAYFINIGKNKTEEEIAEKLFSYYKDDTVFSPLLIDMRPGIKGRQQETYQEQISKMLQLRDKYPDKLLPFVSLDPNNPEMDQIFINAFKNHDFFGLKIYPSLGYLPSHPDLMEVFAVCEEKQIPVNTHCSTALVRTSRNLVRNIKGKMYFFNNLVDAPSWKWFFGIKSYSEFFNHPKCWGPVLKAFPRLKLNFAHFGGTQQWDKLKKGKMNWVYYVLNLMEKYENVYADIAYNMVCQDFFDSFLKFYHKNSLVREKTLFGSDYYMAVIEGYFRQNKQRFLAYSGDDIIHQIAHINPKKWLFG